MIQFNPLTLLGQNLTAQTAVTGSELAHPPSDSSFTSLASPGDLLNGTLSGLTVAAAALGSPTLARITSHPLFAGAALLTGMSHQVQAWGHVGGLLSGALLFLTSVATVVSGYSFYRGFKAGWQALKTSSQLAIYDHVRSLQKDAEARLEKAVKKTQHPILKEVKKLAEETHADVKTAVEHFKDLRDEKPQRIEAAYFSGLVDNPNVHDLIRHRVEAAIFPMELYPNASAIIRRRVAEASAEALKDVRLNALAQMNDEAFQGVRMRVLRKVGETFHVMRKDGVAGTDLKAYQAIFQNIGQAMTESLEKARADGLTVLRGEVSQAIRRRAALARTEALEAAEKAVLTSRLVPAMISRLREKLDSETAADVKAALESTLKIERLLATTAKENGVVSRWLALPASPTKAAKAEQDRKVEEDPENEKPLADPRAYVRKTALHADESQRVASASPRNWVSEAIGDPTYSPAGKAVGHWLGATVNPSLRYGVPAVVGLQVVEAGIAAFQGQATGNFWGHLLTWGLSLAPMAATYLYNKRQGSRRMKVSPGAHQEYNLELYADKKLQTRTSERLDRAIPPMEDGERERFLEETRKTLKKVEADVTALEALEVPSARKSGILPNGEISLGNTSWQIEPSRRFTPHPTPDPNRPYAYDHRPGGPDTEEKRRIRTAIKAMPLDQLDEAIRRGDVTHVDILNMICDHPASRDGAVMPRPLTGKLRRELMKLARGADETGVIRHFVAVKDLFPGVDGVVTAGSKTTYLEDLGKSPLVQKILETDIPLPCGLTAGANGGSGLYNGHGAVGNPRVPGHDTAGSSSAAAYLLSLEDMPIRLAVGTDTGGSISAPCGAAKLYGWVPEKGLLSMVNMIPFATHLDTPGVLGVDRGEVLRFAKRLTGTAYQSHYRAPNEAPEVFYFESDLTQVSENSRENFKHRLDGIRTKGFPVTSLDKRYSRIRSIPLDLYIDSYVAAAFTLMNPREDNWIEPQRYILDRNLQNRLAKANALLKAKDEEHGNLFNRLLDLHVRFRNLVQRKFPDGSVFVTPTPEAVPLDDFRPNGAAGAKLDSHDILGGMLKNRTDRALFIDSAKRLVIEGTTSGILAVSEGRNVAVMAGRIESELSERFPNLAQEKYRALVRLMAKDTIQSWSDDGCPLAVNDALQRRIPESYVDRTLAHLVNTLQKSNKKEILDELRANNRGNRARRAAKASVQENQAA